MQYAAGGYLAEALNIPFSFDTFSGCALSLYVNYKIKILIAHIKVFFVNLSSVRSVRILSAYIYLQGLHTRRLNMPCTTLRNV